MAKRAVTTDVYRYYGAYERLRQSLLEDTKNHRLNQTLGYWVLPADKRLPVAFLDRQLSDILSHSLDELLETPGVGQKKIGGLITLLKRATRTIPDSGDFGLTDAGERRRKKQGKQNGFDPDTVSEELWSHWRETAKRCGVGKYPIGRLAPTLQSLPTVVWDTPLDRYVDLKLDAIRSLKTHGEKRVNAILQVFCCIHEALSTAMLQDHIEIALVPKFATPIAEWLLERLTEEDAPTAKELHENVATPLVNQIQTDLGKQVAKLAAARVSLNPNAPNVRTQAKRLNVTRARVYQLFEDCAQVAQVRWPEGHRLIASLGSCLALADDVEALDQYRSIRDLFFPKDHATVPELELVETV